MELKDKEPEAEVYCPRLTPDLLDKIIANVMEKGEKHASGVPLFFDKHTLKRAILETIANLHR